jgi:hypothetical protein
VIELPEIKQEVDLIADESSYSETSSVIIEEHEPKRVECIVLSSSTEDESSRDSENESRKEKKSKKKKDHKKHKKKSSKKKKKKKSKKKQKKYSESSDESDFSSERSSKFQKINNNHIAREDFEYNKFYDNIPHDKLKKAVFFEDIPELTHKFAYRIDKRGDLNNLCFDSCHSKIVPFYKIPGVSSNDQNKKLKRKEQIREVLKTRYFGGTRLPEVSSVNDKENDLKVLKTPRLSENLKLYFELKSQEEKKSDVNLTGDYNKYLNENPKDASKWLEFIEYQDILAASSSQQKPDQLGGSENDQDNFLYKRKLAIFEKAVEKNADNLKLNLEFIKFKVLNNQTGLETVQKIENEFQRLIMIQLNRPKMDENGFFNLFYIWYEYLRFMTRLTNVRVSRLKKIVQKFFRFFLADVQSVIGSESSLKTKCLFVNLILYLVRFYCKFLTQTGYNEKIIGIYQALVDFNFTDLASNLNQTSIKNLLEVYYEANLPKFGEQYSSGWYSCLEKRDEIFSLLEETSDLIVSNRFENELDSMEGKIINTIYNEIRVEFKWLNIENLRSEYNWYPFYPQIQAGESADDCIDSDRLINFEDDLNFLLFNLTSIFGENNDYAENYRLKLISQYFQGLNIVTVNNETFQDLFITKINEEEGEDQSCLNVNNCLKKIYIVDDYDSKNDLYFRYLNDKYLIKFDLNCSTNTIFDDYKSHKNKNLIENFINFNRLFIKQAIDLAKTVKLKENLFVLKWNFEFYLFKQYNKYDYLSEITGLNKNEFKQNLISDLKFDLSLSENRSSITLWLQYAILKFYLSNQEGLKEIRKIFEMLFKLPSLDRETTLNLCLTYVELEFGVFKRIFNLKQKYVDDSVINFELADFDYNDYFMKLPEVSQLSKQNLIEMISINLLNNSNSNVSFKIGIKSATRELLVDKELEQKYNVYINQNKSFSEIFISHKLYSYYLILKGNIEKLFKINDQVLLNSNLLKSNDYFEFYVNILNYLYYNVNKIEKKAYKTRLFNLINFLIKENLTKNNYLTQDLNMTLQYTLFKYKIELFDRLFCTQLIEVNDLDFIINSYLFILNKHKLHRYLYQTSLTLITSDLYRFNKIQNNIKKFDYSADEFSIDETLITSFGFHNQLRKRFEKMLEYLPESVGLWSLYFRFEYLYAKDLNNNKLVYIYYQSIRNLPFEKVRSFFFYFFVI